MVYYPYSIDPLAAGPVFAAPDNSAISLQVFFPHLGRTIEFTALKSDPGWEHGEEIYQLAMRGDYGPIAPFQIPEEQAWDRLRAERARRLAGTDWTVVADARTLQPHRGAWLAYRQALRDFPSTVVDPRNPLWPDINDYLDAPDWDLFVGTLLQSQAYAAASEAAKTAPAVTAVAAELRILLTEAAAGRPQADRIGALVTELAGAVGPEALQEVAAAAAAARIPLELPEG